MFASIKHGWTRFRYRQIVLELLEAVCLACLVWLYIHNRARNSIDRVTAMALTLAQATAGCIAA